MTTTPTSLSDLLLVKLIDCNPVSADKYETAAYLIGMTTGPLPRELNFQGMRMKRIGVGRNFVRYTNSGRPCHLKIVRNK